MSEATSPKLTVLKILCSKYPKLFAGLTTGTFAMNCIKILVNASTKRCDSG